MHFPKPFGLPVDHEKANKTGYVVVYKFKHNDGKCKLLPTKLIKNHVPAKLEISNYMYGRIDFLGPGYKYPDAYVFTEAAQKGSCQLEIARVYRLLWSRRDPND